MLQNILDAYGIADNAIVHPFGSGLINSTWKVEVDKRHFILQKVNDNIFKAPGDIAKNISNISGYLARVHPGYFFVTPVNTLKGEPLVHLEGSGYFRLFPFVNNSHTNNVAETPGQAFEAATQFGRFTKVLSDFPVDSLKTTLPNFHNLAIRHLQFNDACIEGNMLRILEAEDEIKFLHAQDHIVTRYNAITRSPDFKLRVTHHDTKISNVLFDSEDKGICVIDLDTVMPGYFISDVGDMMRTYLSPVSEEEKDLEQICIRDDFF